MYFFAILFLALPFLVHGRNVAFHRSASGPQTQSAQSAQQSPLPSNKVVSSSVSEICTSQKTAALWKAHDIGDYFWMT